MRLIRHQLRDMQNPFEMPEVQFVSSFRLTKLLIIEIIHTLEPHAVGSSRRTRIPFHLRVIFKEIIRTT